MPIEFQVFKKENYFISTWTGKVTDNEALKIFKAFYTSPEWEPHMSELADISQLHFSGISSKGLMRMANFVKKKLVEHNVTNVISAIYCPHDLQFGIARAYQMWSDESPESIQVFRDFNEAKNWILSTEN